MNPIGNELKVGAGDDAPATPLVESTHAPGSGLLVQTAPNWFTLCLRGPSVALTSVPLPQYVSLMMRHQ